MRQFGANLPWKTPANAGKRLSVFHMSIEFSTKSVENLLITRITAGAKPLLALLREFTRGFHVGWCVLHALRSPAHKRESSGFRRAKPRVSFAPLCDPGRHRADRSARSRVT